MKGLFLDAWTVMNKELREIAASRGGVQGGSLTVLLIGVLLGVLLPLESVLLGSSHSWLLVLWGWLPVFVVAIAVTDLIAGERERHTLETLLASPLPDRAILLGKVAAAVIYGWGVLLLCMAVGIITMAIVQGAGVDQFYAPKMLIGVALLGFLAALLAAAISALICLRVASARQAHQLVILTVLSLFFVHVVGLPLLEHLLPEPWQDTITNLLGALERPETILIIASVLAILGVALLWLASSWFHRNRLNLD